MYTTVYHTQPINNKSFLVTGGSGFIGSNIVSYLMKHNAGKVRVMDNLATGFKRNIEMHFDDPRFEFIEGDIRELEDCKRACADIDYVCHQAALGSVPRSLKAPLDTHAVNVTGFLNILTAARDAGAKRVVYASSSSVYGDHPALPKREENIGKPLSPYAVSKQADEIYAHVFASAYNMEIIGLRYFNIFGPNQSPEGPYAAVIPLFMDAVLNGAPPFIDGDGEQTRDFTFIENAVQANIKALLTETENAVNQVYNIAVGESLSVNQLFDTISRISNSNLKPVHRPSRSGDVRNSLADISKASQLLGYMPSVKSEEGLRLTFEWYKRAVKHA